MPAILGAGDRVAIAVPAAGIVVDGSVEDWPAAAPAYPLHRVTAGTSPTGAEDLDASFRLAWDEAGRLYVAFDLLDDAFVVDPSTGADWRTQDGVELFLRTVDAGDDSAIRQIALWGERLVGGEDGVLVQTRHDGAHRRIEWRIDAGRLGLDLRAGTRLALDLAVNDRDTDGSFTTVKWGAADARASGLGQVLILPAGTITGILEGTVRRGGAAVARGRLRVGSMAHAGWAWDLEADRQGRFALRLPHGSYTLSSLPAGTGDPVTAVLSGPRTDVVVRIARRPRSVRHLGEGVAIAAGEGTPVEASFGIQKGLWRTFGLPDGLASTIIDAIYQDRDGYLWFGTQGGVSRFDGTTFTTFTIDDGLAYNGVSAIVEDGDGALWFGTWGGGLSRYDGHTFTTYTTADGLAGDVVLALHRDRAGHVWIGTQSGLNRLDGNRLRAYSVADGLPHASVSAIAEAADGTLWFGTWGGGASRYDGKRFTTYTRADGLGDDEVSDITIDADGNVWFATQGGVSCFADGRFRRYTEADGLAHDAASSLAFDALGRLWVGTWEGGVSRRDGDGFTTFDHGDGLAHDEVSVIAADSDGHLWFGTWGGGVSRYDGTHFVHFSERDLAGAGRTLWQDRAGRLWVGTSAGLYRRDGSRFRRFTTADGLAHDAVNSMTEDVDGHLWIGTQGGLSRYDGGGRFTTFTTADGLPHDWVNTVHADARGDLWLGTWGGGASRYDGESFVTFDAASGIGHDWINTIYEDGFGRLWFGTKGGGVTQLDGGTFTRLTSDDGLAANWVWSIAEDRDGIMWFGTDNGVSCYEDGTLTTLTSRDGLSSDHVSAILQDESGRYWFGTEGGGVTLYDGETFQDILVRDGLLDNVVHALLQDRDGRMWIATSRGLTLHRPRLSPPPIHLVDVVADRRYGATDRIAISAAQNFLAFEFEGVSLKTRPGALLYRHRLLGYDAAELLSGLNRVEYVDLPLGEYTFVVEAIDRDLTSSSQPVRVAVQVHPPYGDIVLYASLVTVVLGLAWAVGQIVQRNRRLQIARDEADAARQEADAANEAKSTFLANMSHEIRTPMNGIVGMVDMLRRTGLEKSQRNYLAVIDTSATALLELINDILDLSKIEAGGMELEEIDFVLWDVLDGVMKLMAMRAHEKGLELACHVAADVPEGLRGDPTRLRQIIVNLIGNAIKFTAAGEVVLRVERSAGADEGVELHFAVRDTGIGIPEDKQALIFEAFSQADSSTTRQFGGTGLGLNISRQLVELMGGRIWIESEVGVGSTFQFKARFGLSGARAADIAAEPWKQLGAARILALEANATNRRIIAEMLASWGFQATVLSSGEEALDELRRAHGAGIPYALALLDAHATPVNGIDVARQICRQPGLVEHVALLLTALDNPEESGVLKAIGIEHTLRRPITRSDLLDTIVTALGPAAGVRRRSGDGESAAQCLPPLSILLADDNETNQYVGTSMLEEQGHRVVTADNGRLVLEALEEADFDLVLMDVQMPEMDGYETTAEIRRREHASGRHLPIIGLTANAMKGDREACLEAGMDEYVPKPVRWETLREAILKLQITGRVLPPHGASVEGTPHTAGAVVAAEFIAFDPDLFDGEEEEEEEPAQDIDYELLAQFEEDAARSAHEALLDHTALDNLRQMEERGAISVRRMFDLFVDTGERVLPILRQRLHDQDAPVLRREAHSFKSSAAYLGARRLTTLCQRLEDQAAAQVFDGAADLIDEIETAFAAARQALLDRLPASGDAEDEAAGGTEDREDLDEETPENLPELVARLEQQRQRWEALRTTMAITEIEEFGAEMMAAGRTHACGFLAAWGEAVQGRAREFDLDGVQELFDRYPDLISRARGLLPS